MRLLEIQYPIAVLEPNSLIGGKDAGFSSPNRWRNNDAEFYLKGGFDDAIFIDSRGRKFEVETIFINPTSSWDKFVALFTVARSGTAPVNIDMELKQVHEYDLDEFCEEMRRLALENPDWWKRHSSKSEITDMFVGSKSFAEAINDIGVLDVPGEAKMKGKSNKTVDLR